MTEALSRMSVTCGIEGSAGEIFRAFTEAGPMSRWLASPETAAIGPDEIGSRLVVLHREPPSRLAVTLGTDAPGFAGEPGIVSLGLMDFGEIQIATVVHEGFGGSAERLAIWWNDALDRLAMDLERSRREGGERSVGMP